MEVGLNIGCHLGRIQTKPKSLSIIHELLDCIDQ